jgi:hypothetical protein
LRAEHANQWHAAIAHQPLKHYFRPQRII